ncbi:MAG TPA: SRPBCC family protein [Longimicrobium sp.]|nr:SRPBCC family protein [Longimicrobium sp.]
MVNVAATLAHALGGEVNVGRTERLVSTLGGGALALAGAKRRGVPGALLATLGAALLHRGVTGHCHLYSAVGVDTSRDTVDAREVIPAAEGAGTRVQASVTIGRSAEELYAYWRDFTNAPKFMHRIIRVEVLEGGQRSKWTAEGLRGRSIEWSSELTDDRPGRIAWTTLPGSELPHRGFVEFTPGARPGETIVHHALDFDPPGGIVGQAIASALHELPEVMLRDDLRRFKQLMETGMVPRTGGR